MKFKNKKFNYNNFIILIPFLWLTIFFALPLIEIIEVSLSIPKRGIPPYEEIFEHPKNQGVGYTQGGGIYRCNRTDFEKSD